MNPRDHARRIARSLQRQGVPYHRARRVAGRRVAAANGLPATVQDEEVDD